MTDKEIIALCAAAIGVTNTYPWNPLEEEGQAFLLLFWLMEKGEVILTDADFHFNSDKYHMEIISDASSTETLRRSVCETVAKIQNMQSGQQA